MRTSPPRAPPSRVWTSRRWATPSRCAVVRSRDRPPASLRIARAAHEPHHPPPRPAQRVLSPERREASADLRTERRNVGALAMIGVALSVFALLQASPQGPPDADTRAWWQRTSVLSADSMEGRDAGSRGYDRAARHVARWLAAAG